MRARMRSHELVTLRQTHRTRQIIKAVSSQSAGCVGAGHRLQWAVTALRRLQSHLVPSFTVTQVANRHLPPKSLSAPLCSGYLADVSYSSLPRIALSCACVAGKADGRVTGPACRNAGSMFSVQRLAWGKKPSKSRKQLYNDAILEDRTERVRKLVCVSLPDPAMRLTCQLLHSPVCSELASHAGQSCPLCLTSCRWR